MKLATLRSGGRDGTLAMVSRDLSRMVPATGIAATMQEALDRWTEVEGALSALSDRLNGGAVPTAEPFEASRCMAPLPRAWQWLDASAYKSHGDLMAQVFGIENPQSDRPLMYQGVSDTFYGPTEPVPFPSEADGIDFEGEFGIVTDQVPMGVTSAEAEGHIRLIVQINDWSLRVLAPVEMKTGFGWVQAKPPCSVAPVAVTPDELGDAWQDGRVALPLHVWWNDRKFGAAEGQAMSFGFTDLIAHAARTRRLCAGTILGSGTVSNANFREVGSSCIAERRAIELLDEGKPTTGYMRFGDTVRMEVLDRAGRSVFGAIDQRIVQAGS